MNSVLDYPISNYKKKKRKKSPKLYFTITIIMKNM